jgi:hypothetical protein
MRAKRWTKCGGLSSSAKEEPHGIWYGGSAVAFEQLAQRGSWQAASVERPVCFEPAHSQSLSAKGEPLAFVGLPYEGAILRYLQKWIDQLRWQRLKPMEKLAGTLLAHLEGILNYCRTKVPMGVVEAVNGNIKALLRRGRGYRDMNYLLLKAQRLAATKTEFIAFQKAA